MATFVALLRGVNVGGNSLKMDRLRVLCVQLGYRNVRTYVQSGNVVFEAAGTASSLTRALQNKLIGQTRLPVTVIIRSVAELKQLIANNPFRKRRAADHSKLHVTFLESTGTSGAGATLASLDCGGDLFHHAGKSVYLYCPNGYARSKLTNNRIEKALSVKATTRNWKTVNALFRLASD